MDWRWAVRDVRRARLALLLRRWREVGDAEDCGAVEVAADDLVACESVDCPDLAEFAKAESNDGACSVYTPGLNAEDARAGRSDAEDDVEGEGSVIGTRRTKWPSGWIKAGGGKGKGKGEGEGDAECVCDSGILEGEECARTRVTRE